MERLSNDLSSRERRQPVPSMREETLWKDFFFGSEYLQRVLPSTIDSTHDIPLDVRKQALLMQLEGAIVVEDEVSFEVRSESGDETENDEQTSKRLKIDTEVSPLSFTSAISPSTSLLLQFDQVLTTRLLQYFTSWLNEDKGYVYVYPSCNVY